MANEMVSHGVKCFHRIYCEELYNRTNWAADCAAFKQGKNPARGHQNPVEDNMYIIFSSTLTLSLLFSFMSLNSSSLSSLTAVFHRKLIYFFPFLFFRLLVEK
jgi:hypothetical protein